MVPLQVATTNMAEAQRTAIDAQVAYAAAANTTTAGVPRPPAPAPPIVGAPSTKGGKNDDAETGDAADEDTEADTEAGTEAGTDEGTEPDADTDADTGTPLAAMMRRAPARPAPIPGRRATRHRPARKPRHPRPGTPTRSRHRQQPPETPRARFSTG